MAKEETKAEPEVEAEVEVAEAAPVIRASDLLPGGTVTGGKTVQSEGGIPDITAGVVRQHDTHPLDEVEEVTLEADEPEEPAEGSLEWAAAQGSKEDDSVE